MVWEGRKKDAAQQRHRDLGITFRVFRRRRKCRQPSTTGLGKEGTAACETCVILRPQNEESRFHAWTRPAVEMLRFAQLQHDTTSARCSNTRPRPSNSLSPATTAWAHSDGYSAGLN